MSGELPPETPVLASVLYALALVRLWRGGFGDFDQVEVCRAASHGGLACLAAALWVMQ